jgi:phospholipid/cholesterol/gamma-HCH transport system permease protein
MAGRPSTLSVWRMFVAVGSFLSLTFGMTLHAITHIGWFRCKPVMAVLRKQIYFTGIQAIMPVSIAAVALGLGMETQMRSMLGSGMDVNVKMLKVVVLRELAALVTAFIVLGRSGAAMATELAGMKVRGEIRSLYLKGIDPGTYLLMPRIIGAGLAVPALTFYFQLLAASAGPALASLFFDFELGLYYTALLDSFTPREVLFSLAKSTLFGLVIATTACSSGIFIPPRETWIPQSAELAVMRGFTFILLVDVTFALLAL